jgi:type I restriction enzyme S subunit
VLLECGYFFVLCFYNSGGAQPKLNQAVCKTIPLILPIPKEQQKIASCLSSLDSLIEAQNKKVSA